MRTILSLIAAVGFFVMGIIMEMIGIIGAIAEAFDGSITIILVIVGFLLFVKADDMTRKMTLRRRK